MHLHLENIYFKNNNNNIGILSNRTYRAYYRITKQIYIFYNNDNYFKYRIKFNLMFNLTKSEKKRKNNNKIDKIMYLKILVS